MEQFCICFLAPILKKAKNKTRNVTKRTYLLYTSVRDGSGQYPEFSPGSVANLAQRPVRGQEFRAGIDVGLACQARNETTPIPFICYKYFLIFSTHKNILPAPAMSVSITACTTSVSFIFPS